MFPPTSNPSRPEPSRSAPPSSTEPSITLPIRPRTRPEATAVEPAPPPAQSRSSLPIFFAFVVGLLTGIALVGGTLLFLRQPDPPPIVLHEPPTPAPTATLSPTATPPPMTIFVSGAVRQPGIYQLAENARVGDAIAQAGGLTAAANPVSVNQAERLWDGAQVHVPAIAEEAQVAQPPVGVSGASAPPIDVGTNGAVGGANLGRININIATHTQLESLPGIGPSKAQAIVENRPYDSPDDLERVPGIGAKTVEQLRDLVVVQ